MRRLPGLLLPGLLLPGLLPAVIAAAGPAQAALPANGPGRYAPRDECRALPGAAAFRAALTDAVHRRDADALAALADADVKLDFGGGAGREMLRREMRRPAGRERWRALDRMLPLGCAVQRGEIVLPWFFAQDLGDLDPFSAQLVTGARVPLRARPDAGGPLVRNLSWQLVQTLSDEDSARGYRRVQLAGTRLTGYVASARLRSPVDYRLLASRSGRQWRITAFIAGD